MVVDIRRHICNGYMLKWLMAAGLSWLEFNREQVNQLNVFPVPDGDTGTNMLLTVKKASEIAQKVDDNHVGIVSQAVAEGALLGARGNSGVILSQLLAGFAKALRGHEIFDTKLFGYACQLAVEYAYKAVIDPVEGTILTVSRKAMEAGVAYAEENNDLHEMLDVMLEAARAALALTPEQLPILKKAGVVDSGGQGLVFILEGMSRLLKEEPVHLQDFMSSGIEDTHWEQALEPEDEQGYGYDVQFLIRGNQLNVAQIRQDIDAMGWSTLVVGDEHIIKVHVHVHDPGEPLSYAIRQGTSIDDIVVENMQQQYENFVAEHNASENNSHHTASVAVIAVVSGDGMEYLFKNDMGAAIVIQGGQTMNPSTEDFIAAIKRVPQNDIILLPNNSNILMAAQQAAKLTQNKNIKVVTSKNIPQGINAMIAYVNLKAHGELDEIFAEMQNALDEVATAEITTATRSVSLDGVDANQGHYIGLFEGKLLSSGEDLEDVVLGLLNLIEIDDYELITLYHGQDVRTRLAKQLGDTLADKYSDQEVHVVYGGQPLYPYIISLE